MTPHSRQAVLRKPRDCWRSFWGKLYQSYTRNGKPLAESKWNASCDWLLRWYRKKVNAPGRIIPSRFPYAAWGAEGTGWPALAFVAWNFPATNVMRSAGALAAGCSIIIAKWGDAGNCCRYWNSIDGCWLASWRAKHVLRARTGIRAPTILDYPQLSFTGSVPVGIHLQQLAAEFNPYDGIGGHSPVGVKDADIDAAAQLCTQGKFRNAGQFAFHQPGSLLKSQFMTNFWKHSKACGSG